MMNVKYKHAVQVDPDICIGCSHCMKVCPTQAIRIVDGHASISPERCVDCGECYRICPVSAIFVEDDKISVINDYQYRVALLPSVFLGQFPSEFSVPEILNAVHELGFHYVFEVEHAVDLLKEEYRKRGEESILQPAISSYCPAVVRLIQVVFPSLTDHILQLKAPHDIAALFVREQIKNEDVANSDVGVFYVTPCASKIVAAKSPVGEDVSPIDGVINMNELFNKVYHILINLKKQDVKVKTKFPTQLSPDSVNWSLNGVEKKYFKGRSLAIDGMDNVIEFLEKIESGQIGDIDFLELRACDQGCAGGILCPSNRFLTVERLEQRFNFLEQLSPRTIKNPMVKFGNQQEDILRTDRILPREGMLLDSDIDQALRKIDKQKKILDYLPGFDCGACGAPTCKALAEDIVKTTASMSHCVFVQRIMEKNYKLSPNQAFQMIEKIWGKDRLNKL